MGMKLAVLSPDPENKNSEANACQIDMIQTARSGGVCKQMCVHCGAFDKDSRGAQVQLIREELRENLTRRIRPVRRRRSRPEINIENPEGGDPESIREEERGKMVAAYLAPFVTTDVNVEPTDGDAFGDAAELIHELSRGQSRLLCVAHAVRSNMVVENDADLKYIRQIFSLFGYYNPERYSEEEWEECLMKIYDWDLADEIKDKVYAAFVNNMMMLCSRGEEEEGEAAKSAERILEKIKEGTFLPESVERMALYCKQEEGEPVESVEASPLKKMEPDPIKHIRQIASLFGVGPSDPESYSNEEWQSCLAMISRLGLPDDLKHKVYKEFIAKSRRGEDESAEYAKQILREVMVATLAEDSRNMEWYCEEEGEDLEDASILMVNQIDVTDAFVEKGMMKEACSKASEESAERLKRIVDLMMKGIVPGFILTVDFARRNGRIRLENNLASYVKSLKLLQPALSPDCPGFVAISIQGLPQGPGVPSDHPYTAERAHIFFQQVLKRSGLSREEIARIKYDRGRSYVLAGRAATDPLLKDFLNEEDGCEVIPYQDFVDRVIAPQRKFFRGRLRATGSVDVQVVEDGRTYNSTLRPELWEKFLDCPAIREYTRSGIVRGLDGEIGSVVLLSDEERERKRDLRWENDIEREDDIFLIKPFSLLKRADREEVLNFMREVLGVGTICDCKISEGEGERHIRFQDFKLRLLKAFYPDKDVNLIVAQRSPYSDVVKRYSERGLDVGVTLGEENWYAGEIIAVAEALETRLGLNYLLERLDSVYLNRRAYESDGEEDDDLNFDSGLFKEEPGDGIEEVSNEGGDSNFGEIDTDPDPLRSMPN